MENLRNESLTEKNYPFSVDDINIPHSLKRSIWLIKDSEDGNNYTADELLEGISKDFFYNMRSTLTAAYKSAIPKFICPFCSQPLGLKARNIDNNNDDDDEEEFFPFFSHYQNSDNSCEVKTTYEIDPTRIVITSEERFKESFLHHDMVSKIKEILEISHNFKKIETGKVISTPEITGFRRPSLYSVYQNRYQVCFDILVNNPQIGLLVGRNAFYKMQKMFYLWVFPDFSIRHQRMSENDILYMNRRNVFVFDSSEYYDNDANKDYLKGVKHSDGYKYAYEASLQQKRLMLNCYWQIPVVDDRGEVKIKWEGPELVAFDDLIFNEDSYEVYFRDSDKDFYHTYSPEKQAIIDEWMRVKEERWKNIFDSIERRKRLYEQALARREKRERLSYYYPLIESGEVVPIPFQDEKTKLWGYKVNDFEVIAPTYYDAKPFYQGYAWVRKSSYWGIIDYKGNRVLNFVYKDIEKISESTYKSRRKKHTELMDYKGTLLGIFDFIEDFVDGTAKAGKYGKWENYNYGDWNHPDWHYHGKLSLIDEQGVEIYSYRELYKGLIVYSSSFESKCGLMNDKKEPITGLEYNIIEDFTDGKAKAEKDSKWGCINENGETIISFEFDTIEEFVEGKAKAKKDGKWGYINEKGEQVIPFEFDAIEEFVDCKAKAKKEGKWGFINEQGGTMIPFKFDIIEVFVDGKAKAKKNHEWGYIDEKGNELYNYKTLSNDLIVYTSAFMNRCGLMNDAGERVTGFDYDIIEDFIDGKAKAKKGGKWGFINDQGGTMIPFEFDTIEDFIDGKAKAKKDHGWAYIDERGNEIYDYKTLSNGLIVYSSSFVDKCGLMIEVEKRITELTFDNIEDFVNGIARAQKNGKWGCINEKGKTIIPFNYDDIEYSEGKYKLIKVLGFRRMIVNVIDSANLNKNIELSKIERGSIYTAKVTGFHKIGMFIKIPEIGSALVPANQFELTGRSMKEYEKGSLVKVQLLDINEKKQQATFKFANDQI